MQGWSSSSGWRSYNISFSIMHKFSGQGRRQIWQSNSAVAFKADYWTLLQDSVCPILQAVSSIPSCKLIEETCERKFSMHFDYCTTASVDFVLLDEAAFSSIIQVGFYFQKNYLGLVLGYRIKIAAFKDIILSKNHQVNCKQHFHCNYDAAMKMSFFGLLKKMLNLLSHSLKPLWIRFKVPFFRRALQVVVITNGNWFVI